MTYRAKPFTIDAYAWMGAIPSRHIDDGPEWFLKAYYRGRIIPGQQRGSEKKLMTVTTPSGDLQARVGDWITIDARGDLGVVRAEDFYTCFEKQREEIHHV